MNGYPEGYYWWNAGCFALIIGMGLSFVPIVKNLPFISGYMILAIAMTIVGGIIIFVNRD